jgi:hypothetical protein
MKKSRFTEEQIVSILRETDRDAVPVVAARPAATSQTWAGDWSMSSWSTRSTGCIATGMRASLGGRQIVPRDGAAACVDRSLVKAIAWARDLRQRLESDGKSLEKLPREDGCSRLYVSSLIRLAYLARHYSVYPPGHPAGSAHSG